RTIRPSRPRPLPPIANGSPRRKSSPTPARATPSTARSTPRCTTPAARNWRIAGPCSCSNTRSSEVPMSRHAHASTHYELDPQLAADTQPLASLALSELRLMDDANYPWLVLVPRVPGARELIDLEAAQRRQLTDEIDLAARLLRDVFRPFKLNIAALGNLVPQLHVHVIARY